MIELLKKWAEIEPERCRYRTYGDEFLVSVRGDFLPLEYAELSADLPREVIVQAAVQEAIEARGWRWMLRGTDLLPDTPITHSATVYGELDGSKVGRQEMSQEFGDAAAKAILAAYLTALKTLMEDDAN
jgi:hypothetical protein